MGHQTDSYLAPNHQLGEAEQKSRKMTFLGGTSISILSKDPNLSRKPPLKPCKNGDRLLKNGG